MHTQTRLASLLIACAATLAPLATPPANAQQTWKQLPGQEKYVQRYEPFRVVGNLYYVGTYDLAVFLITTPQGHILVNTGVNDSADYIRESIEKLGFKYSDIKLLLATHGHWDHTGELAALVDHVRVSEGRELPVGAHPLDRHRLVDPQPMAAPFPNPDPAPVIITVFDMFPPLWSNDSTVSHLAGADGGWRLNNSDCMVFQSGKEGAPCARTPHVQGSSASSG